MNGRNKPRDAKWKERISNSLKGKKHRGKWNKNIAASMKNNQNNKGKKRTREQKLALSPDPLAWLRDYLNE